MDTTGYEQVRDQMQTGDAMIFAGTGLVSKIIQWRTKSPYSHVAMVMKWKPYQVERVFLSHATAQFGVHPVLVSRYLSQYHGMAWWVPLKHHDVAQQIPDYQPHLLDATASDWGRGYDTSGIGQFLVPTWFRENTAKRFCSEAYAAWLNAIGLRQETFVSPGQFIRQPIFQPPLSLG